MMSHIDPEPDPDGVALGRRLLVKLGLAAGSLFVPLSETLAAIAAARVAGACIASAEIADMRHCRVCGCSDLATCSGEDPCHWVGDDLCSACAPFVEREAV